MNEVYKDVFGYEGLYQVSNLGNVKSLINNKNLILKKATDTYGYYVVSLSKDGKSKLKKVHRLVFFTFSNNYNKLYNSVIDHINNDKKDNRFENLQSISIRENTTKDRFRKKRTSKYLGVYYHKRAKKWHSQIYIDGKKKHIGYFDTELEAYNAYQKYNPLTKKR